MSTPLEDYAIIGDCESAALVSRSGAIDWLCWPRFDSGACFAAILGDKTNGCWQISPAEAVRTSTQRRYRHNTLILETEFQSEDGTDAVVLVDFMPLPKTQSAPCLIRLVIGKRGAMPMRTRLSIRFEYGHVVPWVTRTEQGDLRAVAGADMLVLRTTVDLHGDHQQTTGNFTVREGQRIPFVLAYSPSYGALPPSMDADEVLHATQAYWESWVSTCRTPAAHTDLVTRSLITLKALAFGPTGGIVAAPTTSLPEKLGGSRNWDYRFCWLRDATLTLLALMNSGRYDEAKAWRSWLLRAAAGAPDQVQIMYGVTGDRWLTEREVRWLKGYEGSSPVRVGNAAHEQLQLDVFGEVMDALHQARVGGIHVLEAGWDFQRTMLEHLESIWRSPDKGIWETRGDTQHFTHSKVMAWVAFDRGIKSVETFALRGPVERWKRIRSEIHEEVCRRAFSTKKGSFVQAYDSDLLDASTLLIPTVGFLPPDDPRITGTIKAVEGSLMDCGLVRRYDSSAADDGLSPGEGAFLPCGFWLADAYAITGRTDDANQLFQRLTALCNDVGLLSEEYDPEAKRLVGNFPQAFTHVALVNTAHNLVNPDKPWKQRSGSKARPAPAP